jgi:hypothetical protein
MDPHQPRGWNRMATLSLASLDQKSVAVELVIKGSDRLIFGRGIYEPDAAQGNRLKIRATSNIDCDIELEEQSWHGTILPGRPYGCDYLLRIA